MDYQQLVERKEGQKRKPKNVFQVHFLFFHRFSDWSNYHDQYREYLEGHFNVISIEYSCQNQYLSFE